MKKCPALIFIFFSFIFHGKAQTILEKQPSSFLKHWYGGIAIMLANNYRYIGANSDGTNSYLINFEDTTQEVTLGLNAGVLVRRDLNAKFQFETGLVICNKGYNSREYISTQNYYSPHSGSAIYYYSVKDNFNFWYLDIPLKFYYRLGNKKFFFSVGAGFIFNILLSADNNRSISNLNNGPDYSYYPSFDHIIPQGSGFTGVGEAAINYSLHNSQISLYPFIERSLFSLSIEPPLYLYSYGVGISLMHKF